MSKIAVLFLVLFISCSGLYAQDLITESSDYRALYSLEHQRDSMDATSNKKERMVLLIGKNYSFFESSYNTYNDSISIALQQENLDIETHIKRFLPLAKKTRFKFRILKSNTHTLVLDFFFKNKFIYEESEQLHWNITSEKQVINGYDCTMATTTFAGREYNAWFTSEIPINDGPYKFKGLPGLIIKVEDTRKHYVFELEAFEKVKDVITFDLKKGKTVSKQDYYKAYNAFKKNVIAEMAFRGIEFDKSDARQVQKTVRKYRNNEIEISY